LKLDETRDDQRDTPRERPKLQLQPRTKPHEELQPLSGSSSSINNVAANAEQSLTSNPDDSLSSITNTTNQQIEDSSINDNENDYQQQDSHESNSRVNTSDEQSSVKPSRGAGASIFGGAKPVDTTARELEIEKKIQEFQVSTKETSADNEEKTSSSRLDIFENINERCFDYLGHHIIVVVNEKFIVLNVHRIMMIIVKEEMMVRYQQLFFE
jgi:hypothetical protein